MTTNLELLRKAIRQQTNSLDQPVRNLLGPVAASTIGVTTVQTADWLVLSVPGSGLVSDTEFYTLYATDPLRTFQEIQAINGAVDLSIAQGNIILIRSVLDLPGDTHIQTTMITGSAQSEFALYVGGTLMYKGSGKRSFSLQLAAGKHTIDIVVASSTFQMQFPSNLAFSILQDVLGVPVWFNITAGYTDPTSGNTGNLLEWYNDVKVGGWNILRKETTSLGTIVGLGAAPDNSGDFAVVVDGNYAAELHPGVNIFSGLEEIGIIMDVTYDATSTITYNGTLFTGLTQCRVRLVSTRTAINTLWIGRTAGIANIKAIQRVARSGAGTLVSWTDGGVVAGLVYEYALQAYGTFNPGLLGPVSPWFYSRAGDLTPPGVIIFETLYPRVINGLAIIQYTTPTDQDYKGVRVLERNLLQTGTSAGETSVSVTSSSVANPTNILTATHGLTTGDAIFISGHINSLPDINGAHIVTVIDPTNFTIPVDVTTGGTGGTFVPNDTFILTSAPTSAPDGYNIEITGGTGQGQIRVVATGSITSTTVTIDSLNAWATAPDNTSTYDLYLDVVKMSDLGVPNQTDQLTFDAIRTVGVSNITERTDGSGTQGSPDTFSSAIGGFLGGVFSGNLLELRSGSDIGFYIIDVITSDTALEISPIAGGTGLSANESSLKFEIFGQPGDPAYGDYNFVTFDFAGNQQDIASGVLWTYTVADDIAIGGGNQSPQVNLRQLNFSEQTALGPSGLTNAIANPTVVTTTDATDPNHGLKTGDSVVITGSNSTPSINGRWSIIVTGATTFTIPINVTVSGTTGVVTPPYTDTVQYAIVELSANDPEDGTTGVNIRYRTRTREASDATSGTATTLVDTTKTWNLAYGNEWQNYLVESENQLRLISSNTGNALTVATTWNTIPTILPYSIHWVQVPATAVGTQIDDPRGTRGRLVAVSRQQNQNWLQVQAIDTAGALSSLFTYTPDFDSLPELSFTFTVDPITDEAVILGTLDDDANSLEWWVSAPLGNTIRAGDPVVTAKAQFTSIELAGSKNFGNTTATAIRVGLPDGETRTVHLQPSTGTRRPIPINLSVVGNPAPILMTGNHGLIDGETITISGHSGSTPDINNTYVVTVTSPTNFTIPVNVTISGSGGIITATSEIQGIEYTRTLTRTPRTVVSVYNRDEAGNVSATKVQVVFTTRPTVPIEGTTPSTMTEPLRIAQRTNGITKIATSSVNITSSSQANPTNIVATAHGLTTGDPIRITGHTGSTPSLNNKSYIATVVDVNNFTIPVNVTVAGGASGTVQRPDSISSATGGFNNVVVIGDYVDIRSGADADPYLVTGVASDTVLTITSTGIGGGTAVTGLSSLTFAVINPSTVIESPTPGWTAGEFDYDPITFNTYYVVWEPANGSAFQIRQILSNTTTDLNVTPPWSPTSGAPDVSNGINYPANGDTYTIKLGSALYGIDSNVVPGGPGLTFIPVIESSTGQQPQIFLNRDPVADTVISYYSEISGNQAESIQRLTIDNDSVPEVNSIAAIENPANILDITVIGIDDDTKAWKCYARKSTAGISITNTLASPTVVTATGHGYNDGDSIGISNSNSTPKINGVYTVTNKTVNTFELTPTVNTTVAGTQGTVTLVAWPTKDSTQSGSFNPTYLRFQGTIDEPSFTMQAGNGEWYVIGVPIGSFNDTGPIVFPDTGTGTGAEPVHVSGSAASTPALSNIAVSKINSGSKTYHIQTWNYDSSFDTGSVYQLQVFAYRLDKGVGTEEELTHTGQAYYINSPPQVGTRRVYHEINATRPDQNLNNDSSIANTIGSFQHLAGPAGTTVSLTWRYRLEVWDDALATKFHEYTVDRTDTYAIDAPTNVRITDIQIIPYGGKDYAHVTFSWDVGDSGARTQFWENKNGTDVANATLLTTLNAGITSYTIVHLKDGPPAINQYYNWTRHKVGVSFSTYAGDPSSDDGTPSPDTNGLLAEYNDSFL